MGAAKAEVDARTRVKDRILENCMLKELEMRRNSLIKSVVEG